MLVLMRATPHLQDLDEARTGDNSSWTLIRRQSYGIRGNAAISSNRNMDGIPVAGDCWVTGCDITDNPPQSLHMAAFKGNEKAVESFFRDGATPDDRGQDGERPLHFAVTGERIGMVEFLLDKGADINGTNDSGSTPLHTAAWQGNVAIVELLIDGGAKVNAKNDMDKTSLDWAIEQGHPDVAKSIRSHGGIQAMTE